MPVDEVSVPTPVNSTCEVEAGFQPTPIQSHGGFQGAQIGVRRVQGKQTTARPLTGLGRLQLLLHNHLKAFVSTVAPLSFVDLPSQELVISGRGYP